MRPEPKKWISFDEDSIIKLAKSFGSVVNKSYGSLAGTQLREGDGRLMGIYRSNKNALER